MVDFELYLPTNNFFSAINLRYIRKEKSFNTQKKAHNRTESEVMKKKNIAINFLQHLWNPSILFFIIFCSVVFILPTKIQLLFLYFIHLFIHFLIFTLIQAVRFFNVRLFEAKKKKLYSGKEHNQPTNQQAN